MPSSIPVDPVQDFDRICALIIVRMIMSEGTADASELISQMNEDQMKQQIFFAIYGLKQDVFVFAGEHLMTNLLLDTMRSPGVSSLESPSLAESCDILRRTLSEDIDPETGETFTRDNGYTDVAKSRMNDIQMLRMAVMWGVSHDLIRGQLDEYNRLGSEMDKWGKVDMFTSDPQGDRREERDAATNNLSRLRGQFDTRCGLSEQEITQAATTAGTAAATRATIEGDGGSGSGIKFQRYRTATQTRRANLLGTNVATASGGAIAGGGAAASSASAAADGDRRWTVIGELELLLKRYGTMRVTQDDGTKKIVEPKLLDANGQIVTTGNDDMYRKDKYEAVAKAIVAIQKRGLSDPQAQTELANMDHEIGIPIKGRPPSEFGLRTDWRGRPGLFNIEDSRKKSALVSALEAANVSRPDNSASSASKNVAP